MNAEARQKLLENDVFVVKCALNSIVNALHRDSIVSYLEEVSIRSTKISVLASLLFLQKMKLAASNDNDPTFDGDGSEFIKKCFDSVMIQHKNKDFMDPQFRYQVENSDVENRVAWPGNNHLGNQLKYLHRTYTTNVKNNLKTHQKQRLTQFFKIRIWLFNVSHRNEFFNNLDVTNAVNWAISQYDSIPQNDPNRIAKIEKRNSLLDLAHQAGGPLNNDIGTFTENEWFKSIKMWLRFQSEISAIQKWAQQSNIEIPKIKNLSVIPICSFQRKYVDMDTDVLYRMLAKNKKLPKKTGEEVGAGYVCRHKDQFWREYFNFPKINRILRNKRFNYHIESDGIGVSIHYLVPKNMTKKLIDDDLVRKRYNDGFYSYELGIDPGMKTWNATVRRNIDTGKEVSFMKCVNAL